MKKLVTIVSAVMMLLMLAACAPNANYNAEQMKEYANGLEAIRAIQEAAKKAFAKVFADSEDKQLGPTYEYVAEDDTEVEIAGVTYTVAKGSKITMDTDAKGSAFDLVDSANLTGGNNVDGSVSWKIGDDAEATTFKVVLVTESDAEAGSSYVLYTVNGNDYSALYGKTLAV